MHGIVLLVIYSKVTLWIVVHVLGDIVVCCKNLLLQMEICFYV